MKKLNNCRKSLQMLSLVKNISDNQFSTDAREHSCESISLLDNCIKTENIDHTSECKLIFCNSRKKNLKHN